MDGSQWNRPVSGLLVLLTTLLVLLMPVTEHLSNWDRFLRGGTDVEFSLLAALLFTAMVVLAMNRGMARALVAAGLAWCDRTLRLPVLAQSDALPWMAAIASHVLLNIDEPAWSPAVCTLTPLRI